MRENKKVINPSGHATDLFSDWSAEFIRERKKSKDPFFLFLSYNAPHTPIQPPKEWTAKVMKREKGITQQRAKLVALIEHMDKGIGRVLSAIEEKDNTIVIFTSDNGGQANVVPEIIHGGEKNNRCGKVGSVSLHVLCGQTRSKEGPNIQEIQ